jgi:ribosomal-protein-alanine N-acetyltransferase
VTAFLREAGPGDAAALAELHCACFEEGWDTQSFSRLLGQPGCFALVAVSEAETELQAFALFRVAADEAEILSLATHADARRGGFARALVERGVESAARRGARSIFLEAAEDNAPARALYASLGFRLAGRRKLYYARASGAKIDALVLRLDIPN